MDNQLSLTPFFNTINLSGPPLQEAKEKAVYQEDVILQFFLDNPGLHTPSDVADKFPNWPITSVRRAITNLTKNGKLIKTAIKQYGKYGQLNYCWQKA